MSTSSIPRRLAQHAGRARRLLFGMSLSLALACSACGEDTGCTEQKPAGSYTETCTGCSMDGTTLECDCDDGHYNSVASSLDTCSCDTREEVSNCYGTLTCGDCGCLGGGIACGPSDANVSACCSGYCNSNGTCD